LRPERDDGIILEVENLKTYFPLRGSFVDRLVGREAGYVKAVDGVSLDVRKGEVLGLVGESGSGKTTLGKTILRLVDPTEGSVRFHEEEIAELSERDFRPHRRKMQMVFQDPHASLNPAMDLLQAIGHPLQIHGVTKDRNELRQRVAESLERVGLVPIDSFINKYPGDLSGGQKQRAVLARAIILHPELLVADEPVSMLDMSVRAKILELMMELKDQLGLTYLYITHDLATAKFFCDRIAIMYLGRIVEIGPPAEIYDYPRHPYTVSLLKAIPEPDPSKAVPRDLPRGEIPDAVNPPLGCRFHPRCPKAFEVCGWESRDLRELFEERWVEMDPDAYESEQRLVGDLDALDEPSYEAVLTAGEGTYEDLLSLLKKVREDDPGEPFWKGVRSMGAANDSVRIAFHEGIDPPLYDQGVVQVACHLWDEGAQRRAEEYRRASEI